MSHYISSKPYYLLTEVPNPNGILYGWNEIGNEIAVTTEYPLEEFDTEEELAERVDEIIGIPGWYWLPENRIPSPPRPA